MSSVKCNQCGLINWATEEKCKRCGNPIGDATPPLNSTDRGAGKPALLASCPRYHSENTQSFEMVYSSGTSKGSVAALSFDVDSGSVISTGGAVSRQSNLAASVAPPLPPPMGANQIIVKGLIACLTALVVGLMAWWATGYFLSADVATFIGVGLAIVIVIAGIAWGGYIESVRHTKNMEEFKRVKLADWRRSWICLRCGHRWKR